MLANVFTFAFLCFSHLESPITALTSSFIHFVSGGDVVLEKGSFRFNLINFAMHLAIMVCADTFFKNLYNRAVFGSFKAVRKAKDAEYQIANKRIELGKVQHATVDSGGLLGTTISTIETEKGIYRVFGDIGTVDKGELVSRRQNELYLGLAKGKHYTIKH